MIKKGVSTIVATVLIVLVTVAAVSFLWAAALPLIQQVSFVEDPNVQVKIEPGAYTAYDETSNRLAVRVSRGADEADLIGLKFVIDDGGSTVIHETDDVPEPNSAKVYHFTTLVVDSVDSITIVPIYNVDGSKRDSENKDTFSKIPEQDLSTNPNPFTSFGSNMSCLSILGNGFTSNGIYTIDPLNNENKINVYCDLTTDGGGWTLVARLYYAQSSMVFSSNEWTSEGSNYGSPTPDGSDHRSLAFGQVDKRELMICDAGVYGCNIDNNFSSKETLSETFKNTQIQKCPQTKKELEVYAWGDNYCDPFWNTSAYYINSIDYDGNPYSRITGTPVCDWLGGIGSNTTNINLYHTNYCGSTPDMPTYIEIYVR